jgi:2-amino-4-hydroxy-6-hydroxymethyldihydropteridine diphosphokinase
MIDCFLALGSNQGSSYEILCEAVRRIGALKDVFSIVSSRLFETDPVSSLPQNRFLNAALHLKTSLRPLVLFKELESIEVSLGKKKKGRDEPRLIDIDLIFYGKLRWEERDLTIPHPRWQERLFVLYPLADLVDLSLPPRKEVMLYGKRLPYQRTI